MKKWIKTFALALCLLWGGVTVSAAENNTNIVVEDNSAKSGSVSADVTSQRVTETPVADAPPVGGLLQVAEEKQQIYPQDVKTVTENGQTQILKSYEVPSDFNPQKLIAEPFEQNGFTFTQTEIFKKLLSGTTELRLASQTVTVQSESDDRADILKQLSPILDHTENGFSGQLRLDASTLFTEAEGYEPYSYTVTKTKDYNALDRNDPVYMEKQLNGLKLMDVDWSAQREEHIGDSLIPSMYGGNAIYQGIASGKKATGYISTVTYFGELKKETPGNILYTVVYQGTPIPEPEKPFNPIPLAAAATATGGGIFYAVFFFVWRKNTKIYNLQNGQYVLIEKLHMKTSNPAVDLGAMKHKTITNAFVIKLDKVLSHALFGKTINIISEGLSIQHRVQSTGGDYQFEVTI